MYILLILVVFLSLPHAQEMAQAHGWTMTPGVHHKNSFHPGMVEPGAPSFQRTNWLYLTQNRYNDNPMNSMQQGFSMGQAMQENARRSQGQYPQTDAIERLNQEVYQRRMQQEYLNQQQAIQPLPREPVPPNPMKLCTVTQTGAIWCY